MWPRKRLTRRMLRDTHTYCTHSRRTLRHPQSSAGLWREERGISVYKERKTECVCVCVEETQRFSWAAGSFFCRIRRDFGCFKVFFNGRRQSFSLSHCQIHFLSFCPTLNLQRFNVSILKNTEGYFIFLAAYSYVYLCSFRSLFHLCSFRPMFLRVSSFWVGALSMHLSLTVSSSLSCYFNCFYSPFFFPSV